MAPGSTEETLGPVLNVLAQSLDVREVFAYGALWALVGDKSVERGNRNDLQLNTAHGHGFRSAPDGVPLSPYRIRFKTRGAAGLQR